MNEIKAIIFDMDGVLVDSEPLGNKALREACREFGMEISENEMDIFYGVKLENIVLFILEKYRKEKDLLEKIIKRKIEIYLEYALRDMQLIEGVREFLEKIKSSKKYQLALTTSGRKFQQNQVLAKVGLANFFPIIVTAEDVNKGKPDPEAYLVTVKKLGILPENCLVIEDSDNGIISAKAAGCMACGITTTFPKKQLEKSGADLIVSSFKDLGKIIFDV